VRSYYDNSAVPNGLGRLTRVTDGSAETAFDQYDTRGRLLQTTKEIDALGDGENITSAVTAFAYDDADHITRLTYPDGEEVEYQYDSGGQVKKLRSLTHQVDYISNITYDVFGRATATTHGNGTTDVRTFGGAETNYRLSLLATNAGSALRLSYSYAGYLPTGRISQLVDNGPKGTGGIMDNSATFSYDGLGRLSQASGPHVGTLSYQYDYLGNITAKDGLTLAYSASKPHTLAKINGNTAGITHDANGNRAGKPSQTYGYDHHDRLADINAGQTRFRYDYTGRAVSKVTTGSPVTVYYSKLAESADGWLTKYYYIGDVLVASRRGPATGFAAVVPERVRLAASSLYRPMLTFVLSRDARSMLLASTAVVTLALLCMPIRRRQRVVGITLHKGQVIIVAGAVACSTCPWPWAIRSAEAICLPPAAVLYHFHADHLGSTQLITNSSGAVVQYVRYRPYGEIRGRYDGNGNSLTPNPIHRREFTGYESDFASGLQYAGARFYDPVLGTFLSHDPARQFASPYAYGSWNPLNGTDGNGALFLEFLFAVIVSVAVSAAINAIVAAAQGASLSQIGRAAVRGAITGAIGVGLGIVTSGLSIGAAALGGTLPAGVGVQEALNALSEVAFRSAVSTSLANAAGQAAAAAGAPNGIVAGISVVAGYVGSIGYDQLWLDPRGGLAQIEAKGGVHLGSNKTAHSAITSAAAQDAGFTSLEGETILSSNLVQDADIWNNQSHFGAGAQQAAQDFGARATHALSNGNRFDYLSSLGAITHYIQDQYALGHIFPGTHLLAGPIGAPFRGLIHQTIGGEVNFFSIVGNARVPSSFSATRSFLAGANLTGA
jgi:RHS repeat-associated protein